MPEQPPVIDLGGKVAVMDLSVEVPTWNVIATVFPATRKRAIKALKANGLDRGWLFDQLGDREYIIIQDGE